MREIAIKYVCDFTIRLYDTEESVKRIPDFDEGCKVTVSRTVKGMEIVAAKSLVYHSDIEKARSEYNALTNVEHLQWFMNNAVIVVNLIWSSCGTRLNKDGAK